MWTVIFISGDADKVRKIIDALEKNGIMTRKQNPREDDFSGNVSYEVLVPQTEVETAQDIIFDTESVMN